jgi:hypothetical protein
MLLEGNEDGGTVERHYMLDNITNNGRGSSCCRKIPIARPTSPGSGFATLPQTH